MAHKNNTKGLSTGRLETKEAVKVPKKAIKIKRMRSCLLPTINSMSAVNVVLGTCDLGSIKCVK